MVMNTGFIGSLFMLVPILFWTLPSLLVLGSRRVHGVRKAGWSAAALVGSWLAYIAFLLANPALVPARD